MKSILKTGSTGTVPRAKSPKCLRWDDHITYQAMIEKETDESSSSHSPTYWERSIVTTSPLNIKAEYSGKTDLKGTHKISRQDIIRKLYSDTGKCYIHWSGEEAVTKVIEKFCHPLHRHSPKRIWTTFLESQFSSEEIEQVTRELTLPITGEICIIPKDKSPGETTFRQRIKIIEQAWPFAHNSSIANGQICAKQFLAGTKFTITNEVLVTNIRKQIEEHDLMGEITESEEEGWTFSRGCRHVDIIRLSGHKRRHATNQIAFWLRWNEWTKFERIVLDNTNVDINPMEFDHVYGLYWRAANQKQLRFDEIHEKYKTIDDNLTQAKKNGGKLKPIPDC